jgi:predicted lipoprotein with Yx(FWY)xxD motif
MKRMLLTIGALAALSLSVGLTGAVAANHSAGRAATVAVSGSDLGRVLVDGRGRTLYLFERDKHSKSACSGPCATAWPPLIAFGKPHASAGARALLLGTTKRADGRLQGTYNHHPLYTFIKDTRKGQTNGENLNAFGAEWYAVSPAGAKVEKENAAKSTAGSDPAPTGYGY